MKNIIKRTGAAALLVGAGLWIGSMVTSTAGGLDSNQPGSVHDPLVTKSFVEEHVGEIVRKEMTQQTGTGQAAQMKVVTMKQGQVLYAGTGAEFIVRNGKTVAVSDSSNGIPDVTAGKDILNGSEIATNHLLIFPGEGRGIKPHSSVTGTVYVMVRGDYLLMDAE